MQNVCPQVFISCRLDQSKEVEISKYPTICDNDQFIDSGPMGGILSAMMKHKNAVWFVLAIDLPFVKQQTLEYLLENRDKEKLATAYRSSHDDLPEPLCTIYEPKSYEQMKILFESINMLDLLFK